MATDDDQIQLPIAYLGVEETPIVFANQFAIQHFQNEFIITIGQIAPPILVGSPEERREQAKNVGYIPVTIVGRFSLTKERIRELIGALQENLSNYEKGEPK